MKEAGHAAHRCGQHGLDCGRHHEVAVQEEHGGSSELPIIQRRLLALNDALGALMLTRFALPCYLGWVHVTGSS